MTNKECQIIVDGYVHASDFTVIGRCGDVPIRVGDVFDVVSRNQRRRYPDEMGDEPVREVEKPAAIHVICIHAYEMSLEMLGEGMTGSLTLEGDGLQYIAPGWILGRKSEVPSGGEQETKPAVASV